MDLINNAENIIHLWKSKYLPILNIMFHSNEVIPGASPYTANEKDVQNLLMSLEKLFSHLKNKYQLLSIGLSDTNNLRKLLTKRS